MNIFIFASRKLHVTGQVAEFELEKSDQGGASFRITMIVFGATKSRPLQLEGAYSSMFF
jgi:hypothetical protein